MSLKAELLIDAHALVGEGPIWDADANLLWWVDIMASELYAYDPQSDENRKWDAGQHVGTVVQRASGGLMLALRDGFAAFDPTTAALEWLTDPEAHLPGKPFQRRQVRPRPAASGRAQWPMKTSRTRAVSTAWTPTTASTG